MESTRRNEKSDFKVGFDVDDGVAYLCYKDKPCSYLNSFLAVWIDDDEVAASPLESLDDAVTFIEIIRKLLETVHNCNNKKSNDIEVK